jgi:hypothetical protein
VRSIFQGMTKIENLPDSLRRRVQGRDIIV